MDMDIEAVAKTHGNVIDARKLTVADLPTCFSVIKPAVSQGVEISLRVNQAEYILYLWLFRKDVNRLPLIHLANPEQYDFHNHVNWCGEVCYVDNTLPQFIDVDFQENIVLQSISCTADVLNTSYDRNLSALFDEFEGYWRSLPGCYKDVNCFWKPASDPSLIYMLTKRKIPCAIIKNSVNAIYGGYDMLSNTTRISGYYIPLETVLLPPLPGQSLDIGYVRILLSAVSESKKEKVFKSLDRILRKKGKSTQSRTGCLLFSMPRPSGSFLLFGVWVQGHSSTRVEEFNPDEKWDVKPLEVDRHYDEFLITRGGADSQCSKYKVAIVGCGAVGSRIAEFVCQAGIQNITLVDNDILKKDNIYRHTLGGDYIGREKTDALAEGLSKRLPQVNFVTVSTGWNDFVKNNDLSDFDLLFCATGDPTHMRSINKYIIEQKKMVAAIYAWVEADSVAGHALLVSPNLPGCFECLIQRSEFGLSLKGSVLEPNQRVAKELFGCGSFVPFTVTDAVKTAALATELAVDYLLYSVPNTYRRWKGVSVCSERSDLKRTKNPFSESVVNFATPTCSVCAND